MKTKSPWQCEDEEAQRAATGAASSQANGTGAEPVSWCRDATCYAKIAAVVVAAAVAGGLWVGLASPAAGCESDQ